MIFALCLVLPLGASASTNLHAWFAAQADTQTWSAEFTQTRTLKSLTQPLVTEGRLWFAAPNQFRWELGTPAQTIAIRRSNEVTVIYPRLKRAERYPLDNSPRNPMRDMLSLLEAGFPRSQADLEKTFRILSAREIDGVCHLLLEPKAAATRKLVPEVAVGLSLDDWSLATSSLRFADGSSLRNDYRNVKKNPEVKPDLLVPTVPPDYKIVEPARRK